MAGTGGEVGGAEAAPERAIIFTVHHQQLDLMKGDTTDHVNAFHGAEDVGDVSRVQVITVTQKTASSIFPRRISANSGATSS